MSDEEKKTILKLEIANNFDNFLGQCNNKIRSYHVFNNLNHKELLSDIMFGIFNKMDDPKYVSKLYYIYEQNKLIPYIGKAIDNQAKHIKGPFLQKKLRQIRDIEFIDLYYRMEEVDIDDKEDFLIDEINKIINQIEAQKILGSYTFYYVRLFKEYVNNINLTYKDLSLKYKISLATINRDMLYIKKCIIILLKERQIEFPKNRNSKFTTI